jgi:hypothetical protein
MMRRRRHMSRKKGGWVKEEDEADEGI